MIQSAETTARREERIERAIHALKSRISVITPLSDELYDEIAARRPSHISENVTRAREYWPRNGLIPETYLRLSVQ